MKRSKMLNIHDIFHFGPISYKNLIIRYLIKSKRNLKQKSEIDNFYYENLTKISTKRKFFLKKGQFKYKSF
jgi:hypothetical protein